MKIIIVASLMFFISCSTNENESQYPDGIKQPSEVIESYGCGNVFVYQFLDDTTALVLSIDVSKVKLNQESQTINIENQQAKVSVRLEIAGSSADSIYFNYCNDIIFVNPGKIRTYNAKKGTITFSVSEDNPTTNYEITIEVLDLHMYDKFDNLKMIIDKSVFWDVGVGWFPG